MPGIIRPHRKDIVDPLHPTAKPTRLPDCPFLSPEGPRVLASESGIEAARFAYARARSRGRTPSAAHTAATTAAEQATRQSLVDRTSEADIARGAVRAADLAQDAYEDRGDAPRIARSSAESYARRIRQANKRLYAERWIVHVYEGGPVPERGGLSFESALQVRNIIGKAAPKGG